MIAAASARGVILKPSSMLAETMTGSAVGQFDHVGIGDPVRCGNDRFIARIQDGAADVVAGLLGAARYENLIRRIVERIVALELVDNGLLEFSGAVDSRVFGLPAAMASMAAALMWSGVSKSGSPEPSPMTSRPCARNSAASAVTAIVGDGLTRWTRCETDKLTD